LDLRGFGRFLLDLIIVANGSELKKISDHFNFSDAREQLKTNQNKVDNGLFLLKLESENNFFFSNCNNFIFRRVI
jgi:hypothetical protein